MEEKIDKGMSEERWLPVVGYEGIYDVSDWGNIKRVGASSGATIGRILKPLITYGYKHVGLHKNGKHRQARIHRLVMYAFVGPCPKGKQVNHKDGDKLNNHLWNLEYVTAGENTRHALNLGLRVPLRGEDNSRSKLKEDNVHKIRKLLGKETQTAITAMFNVSRRNISHIASGSTWSWLKEKGEK